MNCGKLTDDHNPRVDYCPWCRIAELERKCALYEQVGPMGYSLVEIERIIAHKNHSIEELCYALEDLKAKP